MEAAAKLKRGISRQFSLGASIGKSGSFRFWRQPSLDPRRGNATRFGFGRQSSLDPRKRSPSREVGLTVPDNLDATMQLLFLACRGDVKGVEDLLKEGADVNSIDLDGRTALHIAACEGHVDVVKLLLGWRANIDARDRWGSTAAADAKHYRNAEVYNLLISRGAKAAKTRRTPMAVSNPRDIPEYELSPFDLEIRKGEEVQKGVYQEARWNGTRVSVKIFDKEAYSDPDSINAFKNELTLLEKVRHPNVVQFVGAITQLQPMMIVSEYLPKGDLGSYLQKKGRIPVVKALRFALDIARGMNYLHECKPDPIIHCRLKPKNIFRGGDGQWKLTGLGLISIQKVSPDKFKLMHPMPDNDSSYLAPEVYRNEEFDRSVDVFSFGLILYEMIDGSPAFHPTSPEDAAKMICLKGLRPPIKIKIKSYFSDLKELIDECWNPGPAMRPVFAEIITRLNKILVNFAKQSRWKDNFKFPWK